MKRFAIPAAALLLAACESFPDEAAEKDELRKQISKVEMDLAREKDGFKYYADQLANHQKANADRLAKVEMTLAGMETTMRHLEDQVKTLSAQLAAAQAAPPRAGSPAASAEPPAAPQKKLEDILLEIETTVAQLQSDKLRAPEAATLLKPHARHAVPRLLEEIGRNVARLDYVKRIESVLAQMPPAELQLPLREALHKPGVRDSAVRVVGDVRDPGLAKILEEHIGSSDEDFRLIVGEALVNARNPAGLPPLVQALKSEQNASRTIAISALKRVNRGEDFGYRSYLPPAQNVQAVKAWEDWSTTLGPKIFDQ
ncbi:MAG TPA: HEAT repeat domain-containing protein [Planctomycetota bacterium]|nr:HEAT repeat domain-containing protein [Planctomycetota bacterium]